MIHSFRNKIHHLRKETWQRLDNPTKESRPVFLVGCGRSGTTLIINRLAKSWHIDLFNEDNPRAFTHWRLLDLETIAQLVYESWARIVIFKPILDTNRSNVLLNHFKNAKILFAFRHYNDVINSSIKRFGRDNWQNRVNAWVEQDFSEFSVAPPSERTKQRIISLWSPNLDPKSTIALYWLFYNSLYYDLRLSTDSRVRLVRYESVVSNPRPEFELMCRFLDIDYVTGMAEDVFSSSIGRDEAPVIKEQIRCECEVLWEKMCQEVENI